jgi:two-component system OmpR family sensor kinase/two-component system sensor histidine kinase QseC
VPPGLARDHDLDLNELGRVVPKPLDNAERHSVRRPVAALSTEDGMAALVIADGGEGIPTEERERVFDRFYRRQPGPTVTSRGRWLTRDC